jgi:hypothetical protein
MSSDQWQTSQIVLFVSCQACKEYHYNHIQNISTYLLVICEPDAVPSVIMPTINPISQGDTKITSVVKMFCFAFC